MKPSSDYSTIEPRRRDRASQIVTASRNAACPSLAGIDDSRILPHHRIAAEGRRSAAASYELRPGSSVRRERGAVRCDRADKELTAAVVPPRLQPLVEFGSSPPPNQIRRELARVSATFGSITGRTPLRPFRRRRSGPALPQRLSITSHHVPSQVRKRDAHRGPAHRRQHRQAAGAAAQDLSGL